MAIKNIVLKSSRVEYYTDDALFYSVELMILQSDKINIAGKTIAGDLPDSSIMI